ncbi:MAG: peptide chain release factor N(5)-glutamine methyltransferase [Bacteroidales bacterium]
MEQSHKTVKNLVLEFRDKLGPIYSVQEITQLTYILFEEHLGWKKTMVHLAFNDDIPLPALMLFNNALEELYTGKPIQYILGKSWFNGMALKVNQDVLVPRPETEELCSIIKTDLAGKQMKAISILDIGTGSGCIAIDLKRFFAHAEVSAVDVSAGALDVAKENAISSQCAISFIHADILNEKDWDHLGTYDLIVSNPPYVLEGEKLQMHNNVLQHEPGMALYVSDDDPLLFYRVISGFAFSHLRPLASLYVEINEKFGREICQLTELQGFRDVKVMNDFFGKQRFVSAVLPEN